MANGEQAIQIDVNTKEMQEATRQVAGLQKTVKALAAAISTGFSASAMTGYLKGAVRSGSELEKELLVLRLALGKLKAAVGDAVAPLGAVFIPLLQQAVWAATRLVKAVGKVMGALFGYGNASKETAKAQKALASSGESAKRSLMGFDELNRLNTDSSAVPQIFPEEQSSTLTPQLQAVVDKILSLTEPLKAIDFSPAVAAFGRLKEAIAPISQTLFAGLEWAWHNLLVPLAAWTIEDLLPVFLDTLAAALGVLNSVIVALQPAADWLWENFLKPIGQWAGEKLIAALGWLRERFDSISAWVSENKELVQKIAAAAAVIALINGVLGSFNGLSGTAIGMAGGFGNALGGVTNPVSMVSGAVQALCGIIMLLVANWDSVKTGAAAAWSGIQTVWGSASGWLQKHLLTPLSNGFKSTVNGIISFLNALISGVVSGVNAIVQAVNKLQFTVPNWIPGLGGKSIGFNLKTVSAPKIPYLAQGAVLPANKPFLAVVGDQRHGTNVEAPLATIQQAVAQVTGEQTSAILAGFASSLEVQREILQAVLGIQIGDELIGNAISRYRQKMAVVNGGML